MVTLSCLIGLLLISFFSMGQNIGIGTTTPVEKLDVNGAIRIGTTTSNNQGTIRYNNGKFEGRNLFARWELLGLPTNSLITVSDTTGLLGYGFSIYGKQAHTIQTNFGLAQGIWEDSVATASGVSFGNCAGVWTGSEVLVYRNNLIYRLNPVTNVWTQSALNTVGGFISRIGYSAIWTGTEIIIYGGFSGLTVFNNGVKYNPTTNTWAAIANSPVRRALHSAIMRGTEMIVFGGDSVGTSGGCPSGGFGFSSNQIWKYNIGSNTWTGPISVTGTIPPSRREHVSVWTGTEMLVHGGTRTSDGTCAGQLTIQPDTYSFNPNTNVWTQRATGSQFPDIIGAWVGSKLLIWSTSIFDGFGYELGMSYDPITNLWTYFPNDNAVFGALNGFCVALGTTLLVVENSGYQIFNPTGGFSNVYYFPIRQIFYVLRKT